MQDNIKEIFNKNIQLLRDTDRLVYYFRIQNFDNALRIGGGIINQLGAHIENVLTNAGYFNDRMILVDGTSVTNILKNLLKAQEDKDYILLADLYELTFIPFLLSMQEEIINKEGEGYDFEEALYLKNLHALGGACPELKKQIEGQPSPVLLLEEGYSVEYTSGGLMTLAAMEKGRKFYFHSNSRIQNEAFILANSWYSEEITEYVIYGMGLGYPIWELLCLNSYITVAIFESDINIIRLACGFSGVLKDILSHPNVMLYYDPDFKKLSERLAHRKETMDFMVHYPSLRNISNPLMKSKMEDYFIQYQSVKNQIHLLNGNFGENSKHYTGMADELERKFQGKDLFIVAAGPSLDQNFKQLKKITSDNSNCLILATGTVFRKLLKEDIRVDYVIVTDANARVYGQVSGLEESGVPMLFLSTAYFGFAKNYKGKKYMICQKDYKKAEELAKEKGCHLFKTGGSVSTTALDMGIYFKCRRIIFLGLDLAFTGNFVHAAETSRRELADTKDLRQVEDIYSNLIYTSSSLDMYRRWIENRIKGVKCIEFVNATEGGAKVKGMKQMMLEEVISSYSQDI